MNEGFIEQSFAGDQPMRRAAQKLIAACSGLLIVARDGGALLRQAAPAHLDPTSRESLTRVGYGRCKAATLPPSGRAGAEAMEASNAHQIQADSRVCDGAVMARFGAEKAETLAEAYTSVSAQALYLPRRLVSRLGLTPRMGNALFRTTRARDLDIDGRARVAAKHGTDLWYHELRAYPNCEAPSHAERILVDSGNSPARPSLVRKVVPVSAQIPAFLPTQFINVKINSSPTLSFAALRAEA